jgi:hypothetical protein
MTAASRLIIAERGWNGSNFVVVTKPRTRELIRSIPFAWQAFEHAALLAGGIDARVIDQTWLRE